MTNVIIIDRKPMKKTTRKPAREPPICIVCNGTGICRKCNGTGRIPPTIIELFDKPCRLCHESGKCHSCGGTGFVKV